MVHVIFEDDKTFLNSPVLKLNSQKSHYHEKQGVTQVDRNDIKHRKSRNQRHEGELGNSEVIKWSASGSSEQNQGVTEGETRGWGKVKKGTFWKKNRNDASGKEEQRHRGQRGTPFKNRRLNGGLLAVNAQEEEETGKVKAKTTLSEIKLHEGSVFNIIDF